MKLKMAKCLDLPAKPSYEQWESIKREFDRYWSRYSDGKWVHAYVLSGDIVEEEIVKYFVSVVPPKTHTDDFIQCGKWCGNAFDKDTGRSGSLYLTFKKDGEYWTYCGTCFEGETEDRQHYEFAEDIERCLKWDYKVLSSFVYSEKRKIRERAPHYIHFDWRYNEFLDFLLYYYYPTWRKRDSLRERI